ncbi:MAG: respiratory nitrate reductase subunit beta [Chloroflexi bacterium]|nr:MAG: respiratory nitrate reductase subunit beta [Chloroflexota bacterium]
MSAKKDSATQKQAAMVFDLNKCMGCQTCSVACKTLWTRAEGQEYQWWCTVNTLPGRGHPRDWESMGGGFSDGIPQAGRRPAQREWGGGMDFNYDEVFYSGKAQKEHLKVLGEQPEWGPNWDEDQGAGEYPNSYYFYLPRLCNHCTKPACIEACPRGAMYKREEDGIVLRDESNCRGYQFCLEACPYKKIYFNFAREVSEHCILCYPRLEQNVAPSCVRGCPGRAVWFGFLDDETGPVHKLVKKWEVALPLHPEYETEPNVFYIPPILPARLTEANDFEEGQPRVPTEYLESLFGPRVRPALETLSREMASTRAGGKSELMDTLIAYWWKDMFKPFDQDPGEIEWSRTAGEQPSQ